jgi:ferritin
MMTDALTDAFNRQITLEFASSYAYLQLSAYFEDVSLTGFAGWMRAQSSEEWQHGLKFYDFVLDRGNKVALGDIEAPDAAPNSALEAFQLALEHEQRVTASISELYALAQEARDGASYPLLQWFLSEQVEEEASVGEIVDQLQLAGDSAAAILMLDREYAGRAPAPNAEV